MNARNYRHYNADDEDFLFAEQIKALPEPETQFDEKSGQILASKELSAPQSLNQSQSTTWKSRTAYSVSEDVSILNYVSKNVGQFNSKTYWKQAVKGEELSWLDRSSESIRSRYRFYLKYIGQEEKRIMEEWVEKHGNEGYCVFAELPSQRVKGKITPVPAKKLAILRREDTLDPEKVGPNTMSGMGNMRSRESALLPRKGDLIVDASLLPEDQISTSGESLSSNPSESRRPDTSSCKDSQAQNRNAKKRKGYSEMQSIDQFFLPFKVIKPTSKTIDRDSESFGETSFNQMSQAEKARLFDLFFSCSMKLELVSKCLNSNSSVAWTEDDDKLLAGREKEKHIKSLSQVKGQANVKARQEFLKKWEELRPKLGR